MSDRRTIRVFIALPERLREALPRGGHMHVLDPSFGRLALIEKHLTRNSYMVRSRVGNDYHTSMN